MVVRWTFEDYWQGQEATREFNYTGGAQDFVVPDTTTMIFVTARGGRGGGQPGDNEQSPGGYVSGWLPVTPGETLHIRVGGNGGLPNGVTPGTGGYNGGANGGSSAIAIHNQLDAGCGGGGPSDIRQGGDTLADRVVVAAGAGGRNGFPLRYKGGAGGANVGETSTATTLAGKGGTQSAGGAAGSGGVAGALGVGGLGKNNTGSTGITPGGAGGGGGGFYGGGGGGVSASHSNYGPGGGGSNYIGGLIATPDPIVNSRGNTTSPVLQEPQITLRYGQIAARYTVEINPDDGGSPNVTKSMTITANLGPNRMGLVQEGSNSVPTLNFSGVILTQTHYEALELWYDRRVLIKVTDDLGRVFLGIFSAYAPTRSRRPFNPWFHTYTAEFTLTAYYNASGDRVYGRVL